MSKRIWVEQTSIFGIDLKLGPKRPERTSQLRSILLAVVLSAFVNSSSAFAQVAEKNECTASHDSLQISGVAKRTKNKESILLPMTVKLRINPDCSGRCAGTVSIDVDFHDGENDQTENFVETWSSNNQIPTRINRTIAVNCAELSGCKPLRASGVKIDCQ